jgi:uncharacterized integral membrane protein (TIGR00698 family)
MSDEASSAQQSTAATGTQGFGGRFSHAASLLPGLALAFAIAVASQLIADHTIAPAMLLALVLGLALNRLNRSAALRPGIAFGAKPVLRVGVALLGARISFDMVAELGLAMVLLLALSIAATIGFGLLLTRMTGLQKRFAVLSAGAVAICGASAAIAIASVLPKDEKAEDRLVFTIVGVTILSTIAMVLYPPILALAGLDDHTAGIFIGASVHDVAQVVGAGFSISDHAGETATLVKLLRVSMLAPTVLVIALVARRFAGLETHDRRQTPTSAADLRHRLHRAGSNQLLFCGARDHSRNAGDAVGMDVVDRDCCGGREDQSFRHHQRWPDRDSGDHRTNCLYCRVRRRWHAAAARHVRMSLQLCFNLLPTLRG